MYLLGIDTSTEACTVALLAGSDRIEKVIPQKQHAERLIELVETVLAEAECSLTQLDALVWGRGPGMFTGLRIGAGVVQGLAYAVDRPVVCVSSLAVLAKAQKASHVIAAIDARMGQVYWAAYENDIGNPAQAPIELSEEQVSNPEEISLKFEKAPECKWTGTGSGWDQYHKTLESRLGDKLEQWVPQQYPQGGALLDLGIAGFNAGAAVSASEAVPVYIRDSVAKKQAER